MRKTIPSWLAALLPRTIVRKKLLIWLAANASYYLSKRSIFVSPMKIGFDKRYISNSFPKESYSKDLCFAVSPLILIAKERPWATLRSELFLGAQIDV